MSGRDDWEVTRSHGEHLDEQEIAFVGESFLSGRSAVYVARHLKCASRSINARYRLLREDGLVPRAFLARLTRPKPVKQDRFYKSNFEL